MLSQKINNHLPAVFLILALGFIVYLNSLNGKFIWDDEVLVNNNTYIRNWHNITNIFTKDIGTGGGAGYNYYRPLQIFTYLIDYSIWGLNVKGYHLTNILLHSLVALAIYWLVNILFGNIFLSLCASALFIVHPIHTEAVAYISGRPDSLAALFMLLGIIFYIKYLDGKNGIAYSLMLSSYTLALLSRENSLILPVLLLFYSHTFKRKITLKEFLPIIGITFMYLLFRANMIDSFTFYAGQFKGPLERIPGFFVAVTEYLRLMVLPFDLHMAYGMRLFTFAYPKAIAGAAIISLALFCAFIKRKSNNLVFFSILWFFIAILPFSNVIFNIGCYMAEHFIYVPSIGLFLILANCLDYIYETKNYKALSLVLLAILLAFYSYLTIKQNNYWKEPIDFYKRTLRYSPNSEIANNNLAVLCVNLGKKEEAEILFKRAIELDPSYYLAVFNLGNLYIKMDRKEEALPLFKKVIELKPSYTAAYYNLALLYKDTNRLEGLAPLYKKAMETESGQAVPYYNLGDLYMKMGKRAEAINLYKKALELNPYDGSLYYNIGIFYLRSGREEEAINLFNKSIKLNPANGSPHIELAGIYYNRKEYKLAIKHCDRAIKLGYEVNPEFLKLLEPYRNQPKNIGKFK